MKNRTSIYFKCKYTQISYKYSHDEFIEYLREHPNCSVFTSVSWIGEEYYNTIFNKLKEDYEETLISQTKYCYENLTCICIDGKSRCYKDTIKNYKQFKKNLVIVKIRKELDMKYFPAVTEYQYSNTARKMNTF